MDGRRRIPARRGYAASGCGGFQVAQGLAGQFGNNRIRVAEQADQHTDPGEFGGIDTNHGDGVSHLQASLKYLFGRGWRIVED